MHEDYTTIGRTVTPISNALRPPLAVLTSLRFFAASEVAIFHYKGKYEVFPFYDWLFQGWVEVGYQAVTFFFVLSGFILTYVYSGNQETDILSANTYAFIKARFARVSPAYFLALILALPQFVYNATIMPLDVFIGGFLLVPAFLQSWYPPAAFAWNGPAWSLSVEMFFYFSFYILLRGGQVFSRDKFLALSYLVVIVVATARQIWFVPPADDVFSPYFNFCSYFPLFHIPQFLFGMAIGRVYLFGKALSPHLHLWMSIIGLSALMLVIGIGTRFPWIKNDAILAVIFGLLIFGSAKSLMMFEQVIAWPFLVLLGESSYGIYILQTPVGFWWEQVAHNTLNLKLTPTLDFYGYFTFLCVLSIISYLHFETPLRRKILKHFESS